MPNRWAYVTTGILTGIVAVLLSALVLQNRESQAWAVPQAVDNNQNGLIMGIGGSQPNTNDVVWVIYKRKAPAMGGGDTKDSILGSKDERIALCGYLLSNGGRQMKLIAARDISFDVDVVEYMNDKPHVKDIIEELKKSMPKPK